jgi:hypothetical protein
LRTAAAWAKAVFSSGSAQVGAPVDERFNAIDHRLANVEVLLDVIEQHLAGIEAAAREVTSVS